MRTFAEADKTLCKLVPNVDGIKSSLTALVGKLKGNTATDADLTSTSSLFDQLKAKHPHPGRILTTGRSASLVRDRASLGLQDPSRRSSEL